MGPKKKGAEANANSSSNKKPALSAKSGGGISYAPSSKKSGSNNDLPPSAGYLISCDIPTKQFIQHLNELKPVDKKFILEDLDATHLLVKKKAREEIERKVEAWMDEVGNIRTQNCGLPAFFFVFRGGLLVLPDVMSDCVTKPTNACYFTFSPIFIFFFFFLRFIRKRDRMYFRQWNVSAKTWPCRKELQGGGGVHF